MALCAAVAESVRLERADKNGITQRQSLEQAEAQTGKLLFEEPDIPEEGLPLWEWFWELHTGRGGNGFSHLPLTWADIGAWAQLTGVRTEPWQIFILRSMDTAYLTAEAENRKK